MINIFIADDHLMMREGIRHIIEDHSDMSISGQADTADTLFEKLSNCPTDILILDVSMPGPGFLETLRRLNRQHPSIRILVLSAHAEEQYAKRSLKAGAMGYLTKNHSSDELVNAITKIYSGGKYISQSLAELLVHELDNPVPELPHESLSQREYQIMCLLGNGKSVGDIAEDLSLSPKTISTYRSRVLDKLSLKNNSELMHYVMHNDLG